MRSSLIMFAALFLCALLAGGAIQASAGRLLPSDEAADGESNPSLARAGYLRVVVEPWADVFIDGELLATTPTASRIPLSPGKHYVKLVNPFFQEQSHAIVVSTGATQVLEAKLEPRSEESRSKAP